MHIEALLSPSGVLPNVRAADKASAFMQLAEKAAEITGLPQSRIQEVLLERERLGSTGMGSGVAIPHGRMAEIDRIYALFARLETPVDYEAVDGQPVDLLFLLLAPADAGTEHLKALSRVSRILRDRDICKSLRASVTSETIYALLTEGAL